MSTTFDPYHRWLAVPPNEQPPNHYRLLGCILFESDPDVIESAADRQMSHVRTFQNGQHSAASQRILNEISAARIVLLDPDKKAAYDVNLRATLAPKLEQPAAVPRIASPRTVTQPLSAMRPMQRQESRAVKSTTPIAIGMGVAVAIGVVVVGIVLATKSADSPSTAAAGKTNNGGDADGTNVNDNAIESDKPLVKRGEPGSTHSAAQSFNKPAVSGTKNLDTGDVAPERNNDSDSDAAKTLDPEKDPAPVEPKSIPKVAPAPNEATDGWVAHWTFDEGQGAVAHDKVGGNDGTLNGAAWAEGYFGGGLHFDGKTAVVEIPNSDALNFDGPLTMAAWIRFERIPKGITFMNVLTHTSSSAKEEIYLRLTNSQYAVGCYMGRHIPTEDRVPEGDIGQWVHLAGVYDGRAWHIYRNGEPFKSRITDAGPRPFAGPWAIGASPAGQGRYFQGDIDDVRIYNRALEQRELKSLVEAASTR